MGKIQVFAGKGHGKSPAAWGEAVMAAAAGKQVFIIQFLKGKGLEESDFQRRMEPEIKLFRFEKSDCDFFDLPKERQEEEVRNIRNGLNFAKKVLHIGGCDLLILDEVLGLVDRDLIPVEEVLSVLEAQGDDTDVILTGIMLDEEIRQIADSISSIEAVK